VEKLSHAPSALNPRWRKKRRARAPEPKNLENQGENSLKKRKTPQRIHRGNQNESKGEKQSVNRKLTTHTIKEKEKGTSSQRWWTGKLKNVDSLSRNKKMKRVLGEGDGEGPAPIRGECQNGNSRKRIGKKRTTPGGLNGALPTLKKNPLRKDKGMICSPPRLC